MLNPLLSHNFPIIIPILLYTEDTMVAFIQAMVFALLISIFIRVALDELKEEAHT
jgi:F0F1-type ATP synthase membrane subunit a